MTENQNVKREKQHSMRSFAQLGYTPSGDLQQATRIGSKESIAEVNYYQKFDAPSMFNLYQDQTRVETTASAYQSDFCSRKESRPNTCLGFRKMSEQNTKKTISSNLIKDSVTQGSSSIKMSKNGKVLNKRWANKFFKKNSPRIRSNHYTQTRDQLYQHSQHKLAQESLESSRMATSSFMNLRSKSTMSQRQRHETETHVFEDNNPYAPIIESPLPQSKYSQTSAKPKFQFRKLY